MDCFYKCREYTFLGIREPFEVEERAWRDLMFAVCEQNAIDFITFEPDWWDYFQANESSRSGAETQSAGHSEDSCSEESVDAISGSEQDQEEAEFMDAVESLHVSS